MRLRTAAVGESDWRFNSSPSVGLHYLWVYDIIARDVSWMRRWKPSQWNTSTVSFVVRCSCWIASEGEIEYFQNKSQQLLKKLNYLSEAFVTDVKAAIVLPTFDIGCNNIKLFSFMKTQSCVFILLNFTARGIESKLIRGSTSTSKKTQNSSFYIPA